MRVALFLKIFGLALVAALLAFAFLPGTDLMFLVKAVAVGLAASVVTAMFYPGIRGIQKGDQVAVVSNTLVPSLFGKGGVALTGGKRNSEIRIRLDDGREAVGVIESYDGFLSVPRVRLLYEEKIVE